MSFVPPWRLGHSLRRPRSSLSAELGDIGSTMREVRMRALCAFALFHHREKWNESIFSPAPKLPTST